MSYDRSGDLRAQHESQQLSPPPDYVRRRSVQSILRIWAPVGILIAVVMGIGWYITVPAWWYVLPVVIVAVLFYRDFWRWRHNRITCSVEDGILCVEDHAHPFVLLFINGSTDDQIPLNDVQLDTPTRSFLDKWVFRCDTLIARGQKPLRDIKDLAGLQSIQKYHESIPKRSLLLGQQQADYGLATLETLESLGQDIREIRDLLKSVAMARTPAKEQTQPMPVVRHTPPSDDPSVSDQTPER